MRAAICPGVSGFAMVVEDVLGAASALLAINPMVHASTLARWWQDANSEPFWADDKPYVRVADESCSSLLCIIDQH